MLIPPPTAVAKPKTTKSTHTRLAHQKRGPCGTGGAIATPTMMCTTSPKSQTEEATKAMTKIASTSCFRKRTTSLRRASRGPRRRDGGVTTEVIELTGYRSRASVRVWRVQVHLGRLRMSSNCYVSILESKRTDTIFFTWTFPYVVNKIYSSSSFNINQIRCLDRGE